MKLPDPNEGRLARSFDNAEIKEKMKVQKVKLLGGGGWFGVWGGGMVFGEMR